MTQKINGAAYPGIWVERNVAFIKITFSSDINAIANAQLSVLGTTTALAGTTAVATSVFDIVDSAVVQALKTFETKATVLGISAYDAASRSVDVMVGCAEGFFSADGSATISTANALQPGVASITTSPDATVPVGTLVSYGLRGTAITFNLSFAYLAGTLPGATLANGNLVLGPGSTSGAYPLGGSATGTAGYYPVA